MKLVNEIVLTPFLLLIWLTKVKARQCTVEVSAYGTNGSDLHQVYFKLDDSTHYNISTSMGYQEDSVQGFHLGLVNTSNCSLTGQPVHCNTTQSFEGNACLLDYVNAVAMDAEELLLLLAAADAYDSGLLESGKEVLRELGIPDSSLNQTNTSIALVARPNCQYVAAMFATPDEGPSKVQVDVQDVAVNQFTCSRKCQVDTACTSMRHTGTGLCTLYTVKDHQAEIGGSGTFHYNWFKKSCVDVYHRN